MTYQELLQAIEVFGLERRATLAQIKARHRQLVKNHHPDRGSENDVTNIREINAAYAFLLAYCENYRFCFSDAEFLEQNPEERLRRQFAGDPVWGDGKDS